MVSNRKIYQPDAAVCYRHYCAQRGGQGPYFRGARYQRGSGLGSFLGGFFRRYAVPLLRQTLLAAGERALRGGRRMLDEIHGGRSFGEAAAERVRSLKRSIGSMSGSGAVIKRSKRLAPQSTSKRRRKSTRAPTGRDIFS